MFKIGLNNGYSVNEIKTMIEEFENNDNCYQFVINPLIFIKIELISKNSKNIEISTQTRNIYTRRKFQKEDR